MSDLKSLFKHTRNYFFANIATKALAFISIPVYTRMLTISEYGIINVFLSVSSIAAVLLSLNSEVAISRYYFDAESIEDFKEFVGTSVVLTTIIFVSMSVLGIFCVPYISGILNFPYILTLSVIPVALYNKISSIFTQIYQPLLQSRKVALVISIYSYLAFFLSALFIWYLDEKKYYGYVFGSVVTMFLIGAYLFKQIKEYCVLSLKINHIKYILSFCIPYIPYTLSGIIIAQFARIFIGTYEGYDSAGIYSLANNIAALMLIVVMTTHEAWNPYYFKYMNANDHESLAKDYGLIWRVSLIAGLFISLFAQEGGLILAGPQYERSLYICPILVLGYLFYQWAYVYLRNSGYAKKNIWNAYAVIICGVVNIILNAILIPISSDLGGALSLSISYFIMMMVSYIFNKKILKLYAPHFFLFLKLLLLYLPFSYISILFYFIGFSLVLLPIKVIIFLLFIYFMIQPFKYKIVKLLRHY